MKRRHCRTRTRDACPIVRRAADRHGAHFGEGAPVVDARVLRQGVVHVRRAFRGVRAPKFHEEADLSVQVRGGHAPHRREARPGDVDRRLQAGDRPIRPRSAVIAGGEGADLPSGAILDADEAEHDARWELQQTGAQTMGRRCRLAVHADVGPLGQAVVGASGHAHAVGCARRSGVNLRRVQDHAAL